MNLIPYLIISSCIDSVKMNILPRFVYLFHSISIEKTEQYILEWDKILSRFIWVGEKPRIKYKTLQLPKEKGGLYHGWENDNDSNARLDTTQ